MMQLWLEDDDANTPLTLEEQQQLIPSYVTLRHELNEIEQLNITHAIRWLISKRKINLLDDKFLREIHKQMFGKVWKWAGKYRHTARNIGIEAYQIPSAVRQLCGDVEFWLANQTYSDDEIAVRFAHKLVYIHPFPNGNGRFSRVIADELVMQRGRTRFSWGMHTNGTAEQIRQQYIQALRMADQNQIIPLIEFARS